MVKSMRLAVAVAGAMAAALMIVAIPAAEARKQAPRQYAYPGYEINWVKGAGLPDGGKARSAQGLVMEKVDPNASGELGAGLAITDQGTVSELGFHVRADSVCGDSPRFRLTETDGTVTQFACNAGLIMPGPTPDWRWVSFSLLRTAQVADLRLEFVLPVGTAGTSVVDDITYGDATTKRVITKSGGN